MIFKPINGIASSMAYCVRYRLGRFGGSPAGEPFAEHRLPERCDRAAAHEVHGHQADEQVPEDH